MITQVNESDIKKAELEVFSRRPGHCYDLSTTKTFAITDRTRHVTLILYKDKCGEVQVCGVMDESLLEAVWKITDKIYPRTTRSSGKTVSYQIVHSSVVHSFLSLILSTAGLFTTSEMDAHHCNGNRYDHRVSNAQLLSISDHGAFHRGASEAASQGYLAFISFLKSIGNPALLNHYKSNEMNILFRKENDREMQERIILEFCGSIPNYQLLCEALLKETAEQQEKDIRFSIVAPFTL